MFWKVEKRYMKRLQPNSNCFEKAKVRGLFSFLVKYPQTFIRATSVAFVANSDIDMEMVNPKLLGKAIDTVITFTEKVIELNELKL